MAKDTSLMVLKPDKAVRVLDEQYPDLDRAMKTLSAKLDLYTDIWNYYDGDQPLMYTAKRLRDIFEGLDLASFVENWCAVIVDAANDRINLQGITVQEEGADAKLQQIWELESVALEADDAHEAALVIGESYIIAWQDEEEAQPTVVYNDPRTVHLFYEPSNPKKKWYGAKWYVDVEDRLRVTLYYTDRLEYYASERKADSVTSVKHMKPFSPLGEVDEDDNPLHVYPHDLEEVPIFHFRLERRKVKGSLVNAIPMQNAINKLITDMMVSAEFGAFPQRWVITDAEVSNLKNAPDELWWIPAGDGVMQGAQVGQFNATDLSNFIRAVDHLASATAIITRTPKHYLFQQGGDPSGESLIAMEAPLNKRCADYIMRFEPVWRELGTFLLKLLGSKVDVTKVMVDFEDPATIQPKTQAEVLKMRKDAGIPLKTLLRDEGKDNAYLDQMDQDKKEEQDQARDSLGVALARSIREANQPEVGQNGSDDGSTNRQGSD
jgi:hypothetical protein